jgi:hypothetical protein
MATLKEQLEARVTEYDRWAICRQYGADGPNMRRLWVLACMDERLPVDEALGISADTPVGGGDAHLFRNAGGIVTDDAIRSAMLTPRIWSRVPSSVTRRGPSRGPTTFITDCSSELSVELCSSTRSTVSQSLPKPSYCGCCRKASSIEWGDAKHCELTSGSSQPPTVTSRSVSRLGSFAATFTTG